MIGGGVETDDTAHAQLLAALPLRRHTPSYTNRNTGRIPTPFERSKAGNFKVILPMSCD
jgi:hypothetical protein